MYSDARGSVRITSPDVRVKPALRFNYLSTDQDRREWVEAIGAARHILGQPAFDRSTAVSSRPVPACRPTTEILDWVARDAETALHPSCTCRMGVDDMSVIDPDTLGVHGVEGVRVVDASSMPYVTNGNIYAPVMMLAEKAADLILGNTPLAAGTGRLLPPSSYGGSATVLSFHHTDTFRIPDRSSASACGRTRGCVTSSPQWEGTA